MVAQALTVDRIAAAECPEGKSQVRLWDAVQPGLLVRLYPTGTKSYWCRYRHGGRLRWLKIGDVDAITLKDARAAVRIRMGEVAKGNDPVAERQNERRRQRQRLAPALDAYERSLESRGVVKRSLYMSVLRRELLEPIGDVDLASITLATMIERVDAIKKTRPGTARELRTRAGVFLSWCAAQGLIPFNPMAGYRQPRTTRAQRLAADQTRRDARALSDVEIPIFWRAAEAQGWPFGPYLQTLLLTGQRRTETAMMRWSDVDLDAGVWTIPAADTKSGREHAVPLPPAVVDMLAELPRRRGVPYVFPGRGGEPLSGFTKRLRPVYAVTGAEGLAHFTLHDLRRTMRSGLTALGVENDVAEMMLNHQIGDELRRVYDKHGYPAARIDAARLWASHVFGLIKSDSAP